ncbi:MAG: ribonuclease III [Bacillota bacterium]|nr:ribonuclease III [Bacillota bacterium]
MQEGSHEAMVLAALRQALGDFRSDGLFLQAVTHSSWVQEHPGAGRDSNERLEFLGDAVVGLAMASYLYSRFPRAREGELSRFKAAVVGEGALAGAARRLGLGQLLYLGRGEEQSGGASRPALLADVFEAVCAALYLDSGWQRARDFVVGQLAPAVDRTLKRGTGDFKSVLQEVVQERGGSVTYRVVGQEGPDHARVFTVEVVVDGRVAGRGRGRSKKAAEQEAARIALEESGPGPAK